MMNLGDYALGKIARRPFTSNNAVGVPISMAGSPAFAVYKNSTTSSSTAGVTFIQDLNSIVGDNIVTIDTSADGTFYSSGSDFTLVITSGTISGQNVAGSVLATFSIENRSALRPSVAGRTLAVAAAGQAGIDWANIGSPTTTQGLSGTTILEVTNVETKLGTPAGASVSADIAAVKSDTGTILTQTTAANIAAAVWNALVASYNVANSFGSKLQNSVPTPAVIGQAVWDVLTSALTTVGSIGKLLVTNIDTNIGSRAPSSTALSTVQWTNTRASNLDNLDTAVSSRAPASTAVSNVDYTTARATKIDNLDTTVSSRVSTAHFDSVIGTPAGASVSIDIASVKSDTTTIKTQTTAASIAAAVWNALVATYNTAGTFGAQLQSAVPTPASIAAAVWNVLTSTLTTVGSIGKLLVDNLDTTISSRSSQTSVNTIPTNPLLTTDSRLNNLDATISSRLPTSGYTAPDNISIAAIKVVTDKFQFDISNNVKANAQVVADKTGYSLLTASVDAIASAVWEALIASHDTAGTFGYTVQNSTVNPGDIAAAVWNALLVDYDLAGSFGANAQNPPLNPTEIAQAVWNAIIADYQEVGSTGEALFNAGQEGANIDKILALIYQIISNLPISVEIGNNNISVEVK